LALYFFRDSVDIIAHALALSGWNGRPETQYWNVLVRNADTYCGRAAETKRTAATTQASSAQEMVGLECP
jgi:hypothetical protein